MAGHVQGGKQCGGSVADGVVSDTLDVAQTQPLRGSRWLRQQRLGAIEGLDLRFLVNAKHNFLVRRVEVEPDDVSHLLNNEGIV